LIRNPKSENRWDEASNSWIFDTDVAVQSALICSSFSEALAQETYDASVAGLGWSLSKSPSGFTLSCSGYSEHLSELALTVLKDFYDGTFLQERFINSSKDRNIQFLKSYLQSNRADSHASYYASLLLSSQGGGVDRTLEATESISFERIQAHYRSVISTPATVDCLVSGNISEEDSKTFFDRASRIIEQKREPSNESKAYSWVPGE
jgi:secreted Zn-dependent insulinase-like peptidase